MNEAPIPLTNNAPAEEPKSHKNDRQAAAKQSRMSLGKKVNNLERRADQSAGEIAKLRRRLDHIEKSTGDQLHKDIELQLKSLLEAYNASMDMQVRQLQQSQSQLLSEMKSVKEKVEPRGNSHLVGDAIVGVGLMVLGFSWLKAK